MEQLWSYMLKPLTLYSSLMATPLGELVSRALSATASAVFWTPTLDPQGFLFYNNADADFQMGYQDFHFKKLGSGQSITVQIDFFEQGIKGTPPVLARVAYLLYFHVN